MRAVTVKVSRLGGSGGMLVEFRRKDGGGEMFKVQPMRSGGLTITDAARIADTIWALTGASNDVQG